MTDVFSKQQRSALMARIPGRGNKATDVRLRVRLASAGISGWRMHASDLIGKPDFAFDAQRVAVFIDGCFWHYCGKCRNLPTSNRSFWQQKISGNVRRDKRVTHALRRHGWKVLRFWEHELRDSPNDVVETIRAKLQEAHRQK